MKKLGSIGISPYRVYPPQKYMGDHDHSALVAAAANPMVLHNLSHMVDGSTNEFALSPTPSDGNIIVILDGITQIKGSDKAYTIESDTIVFNFTLDDSETLQALYTEV